MRLLVNLRVDGTGRMAANVAQCYQMRGESRRRCGRVPAEGRPTAEVKARTSPQPVCPSGLLHDPFSPAAITARLPVRSETVFGSPSDASGTYRGRRPRPSLLFRSL